MTVPSVAGPVVGRGRGVVERGRGLRTLAGGAALALLLVACGGGEENGEVAAGAGGEAEQAEAGEDAAVETTTEEPTSTDLIPAAEQDGSEGGVREHRPADNSSADCASISEGDPGAVILFPNASTLDAGDGPVTVEVLGCGNTFEANVQWEAFHGQNTSPTLEGFTEGGSMGDWGEFSFSDTYWTPGDWTIVVFEIDAESGDRREYDEVTFTVG